MQSDFTINEVRYDTSQITESTKQVCEGIRKNDEAEKDVFVRDPYKPHARPQ